MQTQRSTQAVSLTAGLPTKRQAGAIARETWKGVDACERLEMHLARFEEADEPMTDEQVGILTRLADSLATAAAELTDRAERIRRAAVDL
jgi:hypothetical protein